jgi:hypothetical protein
VIAFVASSIIGLALCAGIVLYGKRRDPALAATWGEAMAASALVYFVLFWFYGVIPHQWLTWANNELNWRSDAFLVKPNSFFPIAITKQVLRDLILVGIYVGGLGAQLALWAWWQARGKAQPAALPTSRYGRPLVKRG